jgi:hypothetical protein
MIKKRETDYQGCQSERETRNYKSTKKKTKKIFKVYTLRIQELDALEEQVKDTD